MNIPVGFIWLITGNLSRVRELSFYNIDWTYCKLNYSSVFTHFKTQALYEHETETKGFTRLCSFFQEKKSDWIHCKTRKVISYCLCATYNKKKCLFSKTANFCSIILNMIQQFKDLYCNVNSIKEKKTLHGCGTERIN